jgi:hypothetical protein
VPGTPTVAPVCGSATLTWAASTDNVGVTSYEIWSAPGSSGGTFAASAVSTTTSLTVRGVGVAQFKVRARDAAGNVSAFTAPVLVTIPACPSTSGPPAGCTASYVLWNSWSNGFSQSEVTVKNLGSTATTGWAVTLTFPNGQKITQLWGGRTTDTASPYVVTNETYNGVIPPGGSVTFGFITSWSGTNGAPAVSCARTPSAGVGGPAPAGPPTACGHHRATCSASSRCTATRRTSPPTPATGTEPCQIRSRSRLTARLSTWSP